MTTNKPDVKRYDCTSEDSYHCHGCFTMKEQLRGNYVEWEDYEALQAECEKLRSLIHDIKGWDCDVDGGFLSIPLDLRRRIQKAIDAAYRKQGGE